MRVSILILIFCCMTLFSPFSTLFGENSCEDCHKGKGKQEAMSTIAFDLQHSAHGQEDVTCHDCHGDDPIVDAYKAFKGKEPPNIGIPRKINISVACGKCHDNIRRQFSSSLHQEKGKLTCILCHDKHAIKTATLDQVTQKFCNSQCHSFNHTEQSIQSLRSVLISSDHALANAESMRRQLAQKDITLLSLELQVKKMRAAHLQFKHQFHTFDLSTINRQGFHILSLEQKIQHHVEITEKNIRTRRFQKIIGILFVIFFLICAILFRQYAKNN
jgi:hypothetical protein